MDVGAFLSCFIWALIWGAAVLLVIEGTIWGITIVFEITPPPRIVKLARVIAFLVFLVYVIGCLSGVNFPRLR